jgi:DNA polymerase
MSGKSGGGREEMIRHLMRLGSLAGGVVYRAPGMNPASGGADAPAPAAAPGEIIVRTSPAERGGRAAARQTAGAAARPAAGAAERPIAGAAAKRADGSGNKPSAAAAKPARGMEMKEGFRRDTRNLSVKGLFDAAEDGQEDLDVDLARLEEIVAGCTKCGLHETRTNTVFGDGDRSAGIVFVGEAPGRDEDMQGVPFVGRAGKLLDKMIAAIGFAREEVYIANILKCRPPNNRDPKEDEVTACESYLARQIELIDPVVICALGRVAGQNLLGTRAPLRALREGAHYYNGIRVVVTYHPAALLRNPNWKRAAWEDLQKLKALQVELAEGRGQV